MSEATLGELLEAARGELLEAARKLPWYGLPCPYCGDCRCGFCSMSRRRFRGHAWCCTASLLLREDES